MVAHVELLLARRDFSAMHALMLANEAAADSSNAAALGAYADVC